MPEIIHIDHLPPVLPSYGKALLKKTTYKEGDTLPKIKVQFEPFSLPKGVIDSYRRTCALPPEVDIPVLFPHAYLGPIHLQIMTHPSFPLKLLGAVHIRNHIIQYAPLTMGQSLAATIEVGAQRRRPQGLEFDLVTKITASGHLVWTSVSAFLVRMKLSGEDAESPLAASCAKLDHKEERAQFDVPRGVGKQYGFVTGDINPIHMSALLAKAFGFKRDLAHGMWSLARVIGLLPKQGMPLRVDAAFKGPLFIGSHAALKVGAEGGFEVYAGKDDRPALVGKVRTVAKGDAL